MFNCLFKVPAQPTDTTQTLKFNPGGSNVPILLAAGSWDNTCRIWQVSEQGVVEPKVMQDVGAPILSIDWTEVFNIFLRNIPKFCY
jgi:WD40 repeat protein